MFIKINKMKTDVYNNEHKKEIKKIRFKTESDSKFIFFQIQNRKIETKKLKKKFFKKMLRGVPHGGL